MHARREVHGRAALARLGIERAARAHVVADVGDRDDQAEARRVRLGVDRVVEIARILAVDGHQRQRAQVDARCGFARIDVLAAGLRLAQRRRRELVRQVEARDRRLGGELDRTVRIQALDDDRLRRRDASSRGA